MRKIFLPPGFDPRTFRPVASRYTDYAIPAHTKQFTVLSFDLGSMKHMFWITRISQLHVQIPLEYYPEHSRVNCVFVCARARVYVQGGSNMTGTICV